MKLWTIFLLMSVVFGAQAHQSNDKHPMFNLMNFTALDQERLSAFEAINKSKLIIKGVIEKVTPGRDLFLEGRLSGRPLSTSLFKVRVTQTVKGRISPGDYVYFEWITGGISAYELDAKKYTNEIMFMLEKTSYLEKDYRVENRRDGLMHEVETLYVLTTPRALYIQDKASGKLERPLDINESEPLIPGESFDDLKNYFDGNTAFGSRVKKPQKVEK